MERLQSRGSVSPLSTELDASVLRTQLLKQNQAMARYILNQGIRVSPELIERVDKQQCTEASAANDDEMRTLSELHQRLARAVYPATPRSLALLADEQDKKSPLYFLGPVPLLRYLSLMSVFFLVAMILVGLSDRVNSDLINRGFLDSMQQDLFLNQLFLLCCAGLGAAFANLFQASQYVASNSYDPQYDSTYWSRMIMGLMSGIILVELLPRELFTEHDTLRAFGKPALSMLGGFSAGLVHRILRRLVDTIESLFKAEADPDKTHQQVRRAEQNEQAAAASNQRVMQLLALKHILDTEQSPELLRSRLQQSLESQLRQLSGQV